MIIIGHQPATNRELNSHALAYELIGTEQELERTYKQMTALTLAAIKLGKMTTSRANLLLSEAAAQNQLKIYNDAAPSFVAVVTRAETLAVERRKQLVNAGIHGTIGAIALSEEIRLLDEHNGGPFHISKVIYMNKDGIRMTVGQDSIDEDVLSLEDTFDYGYLEDYDEQSIRNLPVTHSAFQYELIPNNHAKPVANREHISVGTIDDQGSYRAFATILSPDHPASVAQAA